jgi:hypothetical protein
MTKAQWIELIKRNLDGGDAPAELRGRNHEREIELYLTMAFDTVLNRKQTQTQEMLADMGKDSWRYDSLTKSFVLDILEDTTRNRYYSTLPVTVMSIINNNGIRMITPTQDEGVAFFPRWQTDTFLMDGLDVNQMVGLIYYTLEGKKLYYSGDIDCHWKQVIAKLVLKFNEFELTDDIVVPDGKELEIVQVTLGLMGAKAPMDIVDDGTAIQTTK